MLRVALVVPCYNEQKRLPTRELCEWLGSRSDIELVLVDDGSTDGTVGLLREIETCAPERVTVLELERNVGKAEAVRRGVLEALSGDPPVVGYWDADLSTPLSELDTLTAVLRERPGVEIVMGSRVKILGKRIERHLLRHYVGRLFATGASMALDLPVYDTQCGAKLFRVDARTRSLFADPFETRWIFDVELLARFLYREGGPLEALFEQPLEEWRDVEGSKVRPWDAVGAARDLLRVRFLIRRYQKST